MKEAEESSLVNHASTTPQRVHFYYSVSFSSLRKSWKVEYSSLCISTPQLVFTISSGPNNQDYSCTYPLGIEHAGKVEKGRDSDRERHEGQLEAKASLEKVEKEVKKTRGTAHPEKFEARAPNGHHRDYIFLLFVGLACKSTLVCFPFLFKWLLENESLAIYFQVVKKVLVNLPLLVSQEMKLGLQTYESHATIAPHPMYAWCVSCAWVRPEPYIETKCFVSYSFDSISEVHESKDGHL